MIVCKYLARLIESAVGLVGVGWEVYPTKSPMIHGFCSARQSNSRSLPILTPPEAPNKTRNGKGSTGSTSIFHPNLSHVLQRFMVMYHDHHTSCTIIARKASWHLDDDPYLCGLKVLTHDIRGSASPCLLGPNASQHERTTLHHHSSQGGCIDRAS